MDINYMKLKDYFILSLILLTSVSLLFFNNLTNNIVLFDSLSKIVNKQIVYQSVTLLITVLFLILLWKFKKQEFINHFRKGNISAKIIPVPWIGIKINTKETWLEIGRGFAVSITLITTIVIYFQIVKGNELNFTKIVAILPLVLIFSLVNSFVEESITRLGVVVLFKGIVADKHIMLISGVLFGVLHYWGTPGGMAGVIVAGFLGWFLAKSILETKGIFWAWIIHFLQDVIIFSAILMIE